MIEWYAVAAVVIALLAWDAFRRWLGARGSDVAQRVDQLEQALRDHKSQHEAAIKNMAEQTRKAYDELKTRVSVREQTGGPVRRMRFG